MKEETTVLHKCISKDDLNELPLNHFEGEIQLVETLEQVDEAVHYLEQQLILGFDTETRPSFKKGQTNPVALLQLSTSDKAFLFRINKIGLPESLLRILADPKIVKSGAAIRDDIKILKNVNHFRPGGFVELQEYVKGFGIENFSLKKLAGIVLGFRISKSQRLTNWEAPILTPPQQIYAATDAWVSYEIYVRLLEMEGQMAI